MKTMIIRAATAALLLFAALTALGVSPLPPYNFWPCNPASNAPKALACVVPDPFNCYNYPSYTTREALQFKIGSGVSALDTGSPDSYGNCPGIDQWCQVTPRINQAKVSIVKNPNDSFDFLFDVQYEFPNNYCQVDAEGPPCNAGIWPPQISIEVPVVQLQLIDADTGNEIYMAPAIYETGRWTPRVNAGCVTSTRHFKIVATNLGGPYCSGNPTATQTITANFDGSQIGSCTADSWCPSCGVNTPPTPQGGNPISLGSADMTYSERLFAIDQQPMPLRFALSYHSARPIYPTLVPSGPLGSGWTHTFNDQLRGVDGIVGSQFGAFVLYRYDGEGHETQFEGQPDGPWFVTYPGELRGRQVVTHAGSSLVLSDIDGNVTTYSLAGQWQSTKDRWGNTISGVFDGTGNLAGVRDTEGRQITFTTSGGTLSAVTLPTGETWRLQSSGGELSAIFDPLHTGATPWKSYSYTADSLGQSRLLTSIADESNTLLEGHGYDAQDRATTSYSAANRERVTVTYNPSGQTHVDTMVDGTTTQQSDYTMRYLGGRWLPTQIVGSCASCGASSDTEVFTLDADNHMTSRTDGSGHVTQYSYDGYGNRLSETRAYGTPKARTITYTYGDPAWPTFLTRLSEPSAAKTGAAKVTTFTWNANETLLTRSESGYLTALDASPATYTSTTTFDAHHRVITTDGPRTDVADVTQIAYFADDDANLKRQGRMRQVTDAAGLVRTSDDYDIFGTARTQIDANGVTTTVVTDARGRATSTTNAAVASDQNEQASYTSTTTYDGRDRLTSRTMPRQNATTFGYEDGTNRLTDTVRLDATGNEVERLHLTLNVLGDKVAEESQSCDAPAVPCPSWTTRRSESYSYDTNNRLAAVLHPVPTGSAVRYAYDHDGKLLSVQDENHTAPNTFYAYDELDRLASVTQTLATAPGGVVVTRYGYDVMDNLASVTDPNGNVTAYAYDDFRRLAKQVSPVTGTTLYTYDASGDLLTTTDARGAVTNKTYDALGRMLTSAATLGPSIENVAYTYDDPTAGNYGKGRLASMSDPSGSTAYAYERRGLLRQEQKSILGDSYTTRYQYDANGNRSGITYPSQRQLTYTFDYADRPLSLSGTLSSNTTKYITSAQYQPFGPESSLSYGSGNLTRNATYDQRYRMQSFDIRSGATEIAQYGYGLDAVGNITSITDQLDPSYSRSFGYDDLYRLTGADAGVGLWGHGAYSYDSMGNRTAATIGTKNSSYTYLGTMSVLISAIEGGSTRNTIYDAAGNETQVGTSTYIYSPRNYLDQGDGIRYVYDGTGVRVAQVGLTVGPLILTQPQSANVCPGSSTTLTVSASGATGYQWQAFDGTNWNNITNATNSSVSVTPNGPTQYRVIVSNAAATTTSSAAILTPVALATEPVSGILYGDVNHDGVVNGTDVALLRDVIAGVQALGVPTAVADLNGDGKVDAVDLSILSGFTSNTLPCLPQIATVSANGFRPTATTSSLRAKTEQASPNPTQYFFYSPEKSLLSQTELKAAGGPPPIAIDYIWFNGHPVADERLSTQTRYTFTDHLGTPFLQTDATATPIWRVEYEPYGTAYKLRTGTNADQRLRFPGQEYDDQTTDRAYNVFRWYREGWGRYTQADPKGLGEGVNVYQYVHAQPTRMVDLFGLAACPACSECQSGLWRIENDNLFGGPGLSYGGVIGIGKTVTFATFTCMGSGVRGERPQIPVMIECVLVGPMLGGGIGVTGPLGKLPSACGCNSSDLMGTSSGWTASIGPFDLDGGWNCSTDSNKQTYTGGFSKSWGGGFAFTKCTVRRR